MKLPRDIGGADLARRLRKRGYEERHRTGSHIRLTTSRGGEHHITIPAHKDLRVGTLSAILNDIAAHFGIDKDELIQELFG